MCNVKVKALVDEIIHVLETNYFQLELPKGSHWDYLKARVYEYKRANEATDVKHVQCMGPSCSEYGNIVEGSHRHNKDRVK